jgi:hypothetical protein
VKENIWANEPFEAARPLLPPQPPSDPLAPGPYAFADLERVQSILARAGYRNVEAEALDTVANMGPAPDAAAAQALNIGPLARAATGLDDAVRDRIRAIVTDVFAKYRTSAGITPPAACWLVGAAI